MARIFQKGEHVCYGMNGVCLIEDVREFSVGRNKDTFYVLRPLRDRHSTFFIPTGNDALVAKMRDPISRDAIDELISSVRNDPGEWIDERKERMEVFREILRQAEPRDMLRLCVLIYEKKQKLSDSGKKIAPSDESMLKQAEDLLQIEFGFAMDTSADEAGAYIKKQMK